MTPLSRHNIALFKLVTFFGLISFVLFKAIVPVGYMFKPNMGAGLGLCHGDTKSAAWMAQSMVEPLSKPTEAVSHKTLAASQQLTFHSDHNNKSDTPHVSMLLCGYAALQLAIVSLIGLFVLLFLGFLLRIYGHRSFVRCFDLYILALLRAPPV